MPVKDAKAMRRGADPRGAVAIVGAACRLPGAPDLAGFGRLLDSGTDAVTEIPPSRFTRARFEHPRAGEPGRMVHLRAGVIPDPLRFDHAGFGISPREAAEMDPQQRLLLTLGREALTDAGLPEAAIAGRDFGAYVGASTTDWSDLRQHDPAGSDRYMMTGAALSILANRFSNAFDLHGPALTVDTACSSALVALDAACQALRAGRIEGALVGGVNLLLSPLPFAGFWRAGMLSRRGRCQAFGAGADGYVRAEGGVVLVLKRLEDALAAGDAIRGVILATGVNAAGRTTGLSLPDQDAQATLIARVVEDAGLTPEDFGYFEAHGTGTPTGDPIEAAAIAQAVGRRRARPLPVGSVKSNIGHTEAAAGLVGVLKALHVMESGRIPRTLHTETLNPNIPFAEHGLRVATTDLPFRGGAIGVNSFGFGGTNGCAIVAAPPPPRAARTAPRARPGLPPLLLSARDAEGLAAGARAWAALLREAPAARAGALLRGQARRRDLLPHRLLLRDGTAPGLAGQLDRFLAGETPEAAGTAPLGEGVAFVFSGNGAQWAGMAAREMRESRAFRAAIQEADEALRPHLGRSVAAILKRGPSEAEVAGTDLAQPMLFAVQWGVAAALAEQGVRPALCLGHSVGEVAAAAVSGLLTLRTAARLIVARSRRQHETRGMGRMAALGAPAAAALPVLEACRAPGEPPLEIAAINGPAALTIAGPPAALARLEAEAAQRRWSYVALDLDYAFHSAFMDPVRDSLLRDLRGLKGRAPGVPMVSSVTGEEMAAEGCTPAYWWRNLRDPVRFDLAMQGAARRKPALFLEIGPHAVLQGYMRANLKDAALEAAVTGTLRKPDPSRPETALPGDPFPAIADRATLLGADPRDAAVFDGPVEWRSLPALPAGGDAFPLPHSAERTRALDPQQDHRLLGFRTGSAAEEWTRTLDVLEEPWLADHKLLGEAVLPATGMLEMAVAAGFLRHPQAPAVEVVDAVIYRPLPLPEDHSRVVRSRLDAEGGFTLESRRRLTEEVWTQHMTARVLPLPGLVDRAIEAPRGSGVRLWEGPAVTAAAARLGLGYGPAFQAVTALRADPEAGVATADLTRPEAAPPDDAFHLHPARADGALQALLGLLGQDAGAEADHAAFVPVRFGRAAVARGAAGAVRAELAIAASGRRSVSAGLLLRDALGRLVASFEDATLQRLSRPDAENQRLAFHTEWRAVAPPPGWPEAAPALDVAALTGEAAPESALIEAGLLMEAAVAAFAAAALAAAPGASAPLRDALAAHVAASGLGGGGMPEASAIWQQALLDAPALAHELAAVAAAAEALPRALSGQPVPAIPPPARGVVQRRLAARMAEAATQLARGWPTARPFRALVLADADGHLTAVLHGALRPLLGPALRLVLAHLPDDAPPPVPDGVEVAPWDPLGKEAAPLEAELVLSLGLTPRRPAGEALAAALRGATAPGGALLLAEPAPGPFWDLTQGLDRGWWDRPRLATAGDWSAALARAGWQGARALPVPPLPLNAGLIAAGNPPGAQVLPAAPARRFALFTAPGQEALARALAEALGAAGAQAETRALADAPAPKSLRGVVAVALPATEAELPALARLAAAAERNAAGFHIAVRGADTTPESAGALALGRVLANEMSALRPRRHDLDAAVAPERAARLLAAALLGPADTEAEQRLLAAGRLVPRIQPGLPPLARIAGPRRLGIGRPGQLGSLAWEAAPPLPPPGPGEVTLRVTAAGLNFRDVMWAQGILPEDALRPGFAGPELGMECAGIVEAVGPGSPFAVGEAVFGVAPAAFATRARTRAEALAPLPAGIAPEDAAGVPVAFLTALYALEHVARVEPGERVLIHGGAGAVGLAALQIALAAGARVAVTAGSAGRRAFLRQAGAELALDSRDTGFADRLEAEWGGVDVVLNSLSGEAMERSLRLMAPFGRFVELGKRDYAENRRIGLRPLRRNVSYFAVDVDEVAKAKPALAGTMLREISARLADGRLRPLPVAVHEAGEVEAAFRALQAGGHIGKLVILPPGEEGSAPIRWLSRGPVLVTGGTAGFGLEAATWLASRGVRRLALLSRRGSATPGAAEAVARLAALGAEARILAADASDEASLARALDDIRAAWGPLGGVVHAAAVFRDGTAANLTEADLATVWRAKVTGAQLLDRLTRRDPLSLFLMFSSATVPVGSPGQGAYVAANAGLEALARARQAEGLPALAVQWGPIADAGVLAAAEGDAADLSRRLGAVALSAAETLDALPGLLASGLPVAGAARVEWKSARATLPLLAEPGFAAVAGEAASDGEEEDLRATLANLTAEEGMELLRRSIAREVGRILRLPANAIPREAPLNRLGLDSLGGIELRTGLERRFAVDLPMSAVNDGLTVEALSRRLYDGLRPEAAE